MFLWRALSSVEACSSFPFLLSIHYSRLEAIFVRRNPSTNQYGPSWAPVWPSWVPVGPQFISRLDRGNLPQSADICHQLQPVMLQCLAAI